MVEDYTNFGGGGGCRPHPIWLHPMWIWEPLGWISVIQPMVRRLRARHVRAKALRFQKDG